MKKGINWTTKRTNVYFAFSSPLRSLMIFGFSWNVNFSGDKLKQRERMRVSSIFIYKGEMEEKKKAQLTLPEGVLDFI